VNRLPLEILLKIFDYQPDIKFTRVCKRWNHIIRSNTCDLNILIKQISQIFEIKRYHISGVAKPDISFNVDLTRTLIEEGNKGNVIISCHYHLVREVLLNEIFGELKSIKISGFEELDEKQQRTIKVILSVRPLRSIPKLILNI
jgi:hypothetical protein